MYLYIDINIKYRILPQIIEESSNWLLSNAETIEVTEFS